MKNTRIHVSKLLFILCNIVIIRWISSFTVIRGDEEIFRRIDFCFVMQVSHHHRIVERYGNGLKKWFHIYLFVVNESFDDDWKQFKKEVLVFKVEQRHKYESRRIMNNEFQWRFSMKQIQHKQQIDKRKVSLYWKDDEPKYVISCYSCVSIFKFNRCILRRKQSHVYIEYIVRWLITR